MKKAFILVTFVGFLCLTSCGLTTRLTLTGVKTYQPLNKNQLIKTYLIDDHVLDFEEIGVLEIYRSDFSMIFLEEAVETAKKKAIENGANCVILIRDFYKFTYLAPIHNVLYFRIGIKK